MVVGRNIRIQLREQPQLAEEDWSMARRERASIPINLPFPQAFILAWIAFPRADQARQRDSGIRSLLAQRAHQERAAGEMALAAIPDQFREKGGMRKEKRIDKERRVLTRVRQALQDATFLARYFVLRDAAADGALLYAGPMTDRQLAAKIDPDNVNNVPAQRMNPLCAVLHVAHEVARKGLPVDEEGVFDLLRRAEASRRLLAANADPRLAASETVQFAPVAIKEISPEN